MSRVAPGALLALVLAGSTAAQDQEPLAPAWSRPMAGVHGLAASPDGSRTVALADGQARGLDSAGEDIWQQHLEGVDSAVLSRGGYTTLLYARRRPLYRKVFFLDRDGRRVGMVEAPEAVEDVAVAADGRHAAIASAKTLLFCSRGESGVRHRLVRLGSRITRVQMGTGDTVYVACRDPAFVALVRSSGKEVWRRRQDGAGEFAISASADGRLVAVAAETPGPTIRTWLLGERNSVRWADVRPGRRPRLRLSAGGIAATLAYELPAARAGGPRFERRLAYLAPGAGGAWPKGGPFSAPLPVSIDAAGEWVVALDAHRRGSQPRFRLYGRGGERRWLYVAPASILIAVGSAGGEHIATYRSDGVIELLRVTTP